MNVESVREYCLSLPLVSEDSAFGDDHLLFRLSGKIFACLSLDGNDRIALKSDAAYAVRLRERYQAIEPAYHWNKKYWNQMPVQSGALSDDVIRALIRHSYAEVAHKLPKRFITDHPDVTLVQGDVDITVD